VAGGQVGTGLGGYAEPVQCVWIEMTLLLKDIIEATKLDPAFCAELAGVTPDDFQEWLIGSRPIPRFVIPELSAILGVAERTVFQTAGLKGNIGGSGSLAPAIWYKLRDKKLTDQDREMVALVRKLGFYLNQLADVRGEKVRRFEPLFRAIREKVDRTAPPAVQGRIAAQEFRSMADLQSGQKGIGEWIRPTLRRLGILVVESPLKSAVEGCAFGVGNESSSSPCLFANSYRSKWFRRNAVLMHELAHAIFDLDSEQVSIDYKDEQTDELKELLAQTFAQECLAPRSVLVQIANRFGLHWDALSAGDVARLMAESHAEQSLVLTAAYEAGLLSSEEMIRCKQLECDSALREVSEHALTTREYLQKLASDSPKWIAENRNTSVGRRSLRLPSLYVSLVLESLSDGQISEGKAAEMLMMDRETLRGRFGTPLEEPAEVA
jgi:Zn-dependent peptidase ImmA (M78 family)